MALFDRFDSSDGEDFAESDVATRALSVTAVENDFVASVYEKLASVYDLTFGPALHPGRVQAIQRMGVRPGDRILEVGVGTGINASLPAFVAQADLKPISIEKVNVPRIWPLVTCIRD